jgi:hypothetical protein
MSAMHRLRPQRVIRVRSLGDENRSVSATLVRRGKAALSSGCKSRSVSDLSASYHIATAALGIGSDGAGNPGGSRPARVARALLAENDRGGKRPLRRRYAKRGCSPRSAAARR